MRRRALDFIDRHALAVTAGFAFVSVVAVMLWLYFVAGALRLERSTVKSEIAANRAARHAEHVATANAKYDACVKAAPELKKLNRFLRGVKAEHRYLYMAAVDALHATPQSDPLYPVRARNVRRARQALNDVLVVPPFTVPSKADCIAAREAALTG